MTSAAVFIRRGDSKDSSVGVWGPWQSDPCDVYLGLWTDSRGIGVTVIMSCWTVGTLKVNGVHSFCQTWLHVNLSEHWHNAQISRGYFGSAFFCTEGVSMVHSEFIASSDLWHKLKVKTLALPFRHCTVESLLVSNTEGISQWNSNTSFHLYQRFNLTTYTCTWSPRCVPLTVYHPECLYMQFICRRNLSYSGPVSSQKVLGLKINNLSNHLSNIIFYICVYDEDQ